MSRNPTPEEWDEEERFSVAAVGAADRVFAATKAVEAIVSALANEANGPDCERPRVVMLRGTHGAPTSQSFRCKMYTVCVGCHRWRIAREAENAASHFYLHSAIGGKLWSVGVDAADWIATQEEVTFARNQFHCAFDTSGGRRHVVTTMRVRDASMTSAGAAAGAVRELLCRHHEQVRPVVTSSGWRIVEPESRSAVPVSAGGSLGAAAALTDGIAALVGTWPHARDESFDAVESVLSRPADAARNYVVTCLLAGKVLPRPLWLHYHAGPRQCPPNSRQACPE